MPKHRAAPTPGQGCIVHRRSGLYVECSRPPIIAQLIGSAADVQEQNSTLLRNFRQIPARLLVVSTDERHHARLDQALGRIVYFFRRTGAVHEKGDFASDQSSSVHGLFGGELGTAKTRLTRRTLMNVAEPQNLVGFRLSFAASKRRRRQHEAGGDPS